MKFEFLNRNGWNLIDHNICETRPFFKLDPHLRARIEYFAQLNSYQVSWRNKSKMCPGMQQCYDCFNEWMIEEISNFAIILEE
jgi:hypothetical protein